MNIFRLSVIAATASLLTCQSAAAVDIHTITNPDGTAFATLRFYDMADGAWAPGGTAGTWHFSQNNKDAVKAAIQHWAEILRIPVGGAPIVMNIGAVAGAQASAGSEFAPEDGLTPYVLMKVQAALQGKPTGPLTMQAHGQISIGDGFPYVTTPYRPSQLPLSVSGLNLTEIIIHELAHPLGILTIRRTSDAGGGLTNVMLGPANLWMAGLRDDNGRPAILEQLVFCNGCVVDQSSGFDVTLDKGYFTGTHVSVVLAGSGMAGAPVTMYSFAGEIDEDTMGHIEFKNSMMSHQSFRNYTTFMEAELAVLQDIGYDIDRRNFFGHSIYGSGQTIINDHPYFSRNADGTAYIPGTYNFATLGLGLHVYGSDNNIYQRADLLSAGAGGAGIRVDGAGNAITVLPSTRVHAQGSDARAIMFAYGKNHTLNQRGDVQALGNGGIAVSFDFGNNLMGNDSDARGSYMWSGTNLPYFTPANFATTKEELNGPLVTRFDLTGSLAGHAAAITISRNAYVETINIMRGASLNGDIRSEYASLNPATSTLRLTALNFGLLPDAEGLATTMADPNFMLRYDGNITGIDNLSLRLQGGNTMINGRHAVYDVSLAENATLSGTSTYQLNSVGKFSNAGKLVSTTGGIAIIGNYDQAASGQLLAKADNQGNIHGLTVNGTASLAGALGLAPLADWYANSYSVSSDQWLTANSISGTFDSVHAALASPTLRATATALGGMHYRLDVTRAADAYARLGNNANTRAVGAALDQVALQTNADFKPLLAALDFSDADGRAVTSALTQLSPVGYGEMTAASLLRERQITDIVLNAASQDLNNTAQGRRAFAVPFASAYRRSHTNDRIGAEGNTYGVVFGAQIAAGMHNAWTIGVHGAVSGQSTNVDSHAPGSGQSTALNVGIHAYFAPATREGIYSFAMAQVGIEDARLDRSLRTIPTSGTSVGATMLGKWTGTQATTTVGGGWRWTLGEQTSMGLISALDYQWLYRPNLTESGDAGRLQLTATSFHSLRTRLGGEWRAIVGDDTTETITTSVSATWNHELLNNNVQQNAAFVGYSQALLTSRTSVVLRDSISLRAGLSYQPAKNTVLEATLGSTVWRDGGVDMNGSLSVNWRF